MTQTRCLSVPCAIILLVTHLQAATTSSLGNSANDSSATLHPPRETVLQRFLRYVQIDTQSQEDTTQTPSTTKQLDLARVLVTELKSVGLTDARLAEHGFVYAHLPGNRPDSASIPVLGLIAHMDTSPEVSGANVHPTVFTNYQGGDLVLPKDPTQVITVEKNPDLKNMVGDDIIAADGTTLLGSDDKAGCAAILTLLDTLQQNPQLQHGPLAIAFTPDEEIGTGIDKFDLQAFGAKFAFTVDGGALGEIGNETWSARRAIVTFRGKNTHPGTAKGVMTNSLYAVASFLDRLPKDMLPETTEDRTGFVHPYTGQLSVDESTLKLLLRDFEVDGLNAKEELLRRLARETERQMPGVQVTVDVKEDYRNMNEVLRNNTWLINLASESARQAGVTPKLKAIRGGTDGSNLTFRGLPCPDLFTGGHNFHGKLEFNSRGGLEKTTQTLVHLVQDFPAAVPAAVP